MENIQKSKHEKDLAEDTFVYKWPSWLRWVLIIPSAIIGGFIIHGLYALILLFSPYNDQTFWIETIKTVIFSCSLIYSGVWMAPKHQFIVSIFLLVLLVILSTFNVFITQEWNTVFTSLITIISGICIVVYLKNLSND